jgi:hypothetical protein
MKRWHYRLLKTADVTFYVGLIWLTWRLLDDELHWSVPIGCIVLSGGWLALTFVRMRHLLKTYFDILSRLEFMLPAAVGVALAAFACLEAQLVGVRAVAALELAGWALLLLSYRRNRKRYVRQGHGPLPAGCWISPPAEWLLPGDLILTSGLVAAGLRESVGHGETVVRTRIGALQSFSSYMDKGTVLHPVAAYTAFVREHGHYVVLRLRSALTPEQTLRAEEIAHAMLLENQRWRDAVNERRRRILERLPLPRRWRAALISATHWRQTGSASSWAVSPSTAGPASARASSCIAGWMCRPTTTAPACSASAPHCSTRSCPCASCRTRHSAC